MRTFHLIEKTIDLAQDEAKGGITNKSLLYDVFNIVMKHIENMRREFKSLSPGLSS
jgi:hypothetical protein